MSHYRDHLYIPTSHDLNEGAMWDKVKSFVGRHKGKLMVGAGLLGGGYLASRLYKPNQSEKIYGGKTYEHDPKTGKWYEVTKSYYKVY